MQVLTAASLLEVFMKALCTPEELGHEPVVAEGPTLTAAFAPERLEGVREQVRAWLRELQWQFFPKSMGGYGCSFLQMPFKRNGVHWGEHPDCERLLQLAVALGEAQYLFPRHVWEVLPGGLPYVRFKE